MNSDDDYILFELSDGDVTKFDAIRKSSVSDVYNCKYLKRVKLLNEKIAYLEELDNRKNG